MMTILMNFLIFFSLFFSVSAYSNLDIEIKKRSDQLEYVHVDLALLYYEGKEVPQNFEEAYLNAFLASTLGSPELNLKIAYKDPADSITHSLFISSVQELKTLIGSHMSKKDVQKVEKVAKERWKEMLKFKENGGVSFEKKNRLRHMEAYVNLALLYYEGKEVPQNFEEAYIEAFLASETGNPAFHMKLTFKNSLDTVTHINNNLRSANQLADFIRTYMLRENFLEVQKRAKERLGLEHQVELEHQKVFIPRALDSSITLANQDLSLKNNCKSLF